MSSERWEFSKDIYILIRNGNLYFWRDNKEEFSCEISEELLSYLGHLEYEVAAGRKELKTIYEEIQENFQVQRSLEIDE